MTLLEKSVRNLADAIETLEAKLDERLEDQTASAETIEAARKQALTARSQTDLASRGVAAAINDLKAILADDEERKQDANESS